MTKPGDLLTKKPIHELVKEFPEKTYGELERYRNADRQEEAQQIITQQENEELKEDQVAKKADTLMMNKIKKYETRCNHLQEELDRVKRENNDLHNKVAALLDAVSPEKNLKRARESGL